MNGANEYRELCTYHLFTPPLRDRANLRGFDILEIPLLNFLPWGIICWSKRLVGEENWRRCMFRFAFHCTLQDIPFGC